MDTHNGNNKFLLMGLLFVGLLMHSGHASPSRAKTSYEEEYQSDDYKDEYNDELEPEIRSTSDPPTVDVGEYTEKVKEGDNVILHCDVKNLGSNVVMWYNDTQLLSQQEHKISTDNRFSILSKTAVEIKNVTTDDSNTYLCKVIGAHFLTVKITLEVERNRNMTVRILHNGRDVSLQTVVYEPTARHVPLALECLVEDDNPKASVAWTNTDGLLLKHNPKHDIHIKDGVLKFAKPQKHHSGNYQCFADNKVDLPVVSSVMLHIKHRPVFAKHHDYVNTAEDLNAVLTCSFTADPSPSSVRWFRDEGASKVRLHQNEKFEMTNDYHDKHNRSVLVIKNVKQSDLLDYICEVENAIGKEAKKVTLGLAPAPAHFHEYKYMKHKLYTTWVVKSVQPLVELQVYFQKADTEKKAVAADVVTAADCRHGECRIEGSIDLHPGEWIISAKAKNTEGWAQAESMSHTIKIPDDVIEASFSATSKSAQISLVTLLIAYVCSFLLRTD